jgi:hypothetical protein
MTKQELIDSAVLALESAGYEVEKIAGGVDKHGSRAGHEGLEDTYRVGKVENGRRFIDVSFGARIRMRPAMPCLMAMDETDAILAIAREAFAVNA